MDNLAAAFFFCEFFRSFPCHFQGFVLELRYTSGGKWSEVVENGCKVELCVAAGRMFGEAPADIPRRARADGR